VGVEDELDKAKVNIAGVELKSTSKNPKREHDPYHARYTPAMV
jgi:hypothetical protein